MTSRRVVGDRSRSASARWLLASLLFVVALLGTKRADAQTNQPPPPPPAPAEDEEFNVMHALAQGGMHDLNDERWNAYGQFTYISSSKLAFSAPYSNTNTKDGAPYSLLTSSERSWTASFTLYLGAKLWKGGEAYFVPEVIAEKALSNLHGLGGAIQNFELQKQGSTSPLIYQSRAYLQQTIGFGGGPDEKSSGAMQLGSVVDKRRLVLRVGNFSIVDFFDKNSVTGDPRRGFLNMAFMTYAAYDFAADARGYTWGGMAELYYDDWALRFGRFALPVNPNDLALSLRLDKYYGNQVEVEHDHTILGQPGAVRLLGYRNRADMARFDDAVAAFQADPAKNAAACTSYNYNSANTNAPDLCWARKTNVKLGIGLNLEQQITSDIGVFFRGMFSDGQTEVYAFTSTDRSLSFGVSAKGSVWRRPLDVVGAGFGLGWISAAHANYLRLGGVDGFVGDGTIHAAAESVFEVFYGVNLLRCLWLTADYQHITNPAFNSDRGPVNILGARIHAEL